MENTLAVIFIVLSLLIGAVGGVVLTPADTIEIEVPGETVYQNVSVEKIVEVAAPNQLEIAVAEFMNAVENEEDEADNRVNILDNMDYNFDEVSIKEVSDDYTIAVTNDRDTTEVNFEIKLKFKDSHDKYETASYNVTVTFEEDEDTEVDFTKL